jgi:hypothetical protein
MLSFIIKCLLIFWAVTALLNIRWKNLLLILRNKFWKDLLLELKDALLWLPAVIIGMILYCIIITFCKITKVPTKSDQQNQIKYSGG